MARPLQAVAGGHRSAASISSMQGECSTVNLLPDLMLMLKDSSVVGMRTLKLLRGSQVLVLLALEKEQDIWQRVERLESDMSRERHPFFEN